MTPAIQTRLSGWGRLSRPGREVLSEDLLQATERAVLSRGLGRSYGDSALPPPSEAVVLTTRLADRLRSFSPETGGLRAEAGLSLEEINRLFLPRGWFLPVTPGTQHVTLGGAVAADVHGKNHHRDGCFGEHVRSLRMRVADGRVLDCSPDEHPDLFWATVGGMGLTGHVLEVELAMRRVPSQYILQETDRVEGIDDFLDALGRAAGDLPYTVGWIDCLTRGAGLGRGVLMAGDWAAPSRCPAEPPRPRRQVTLPFELPSWALGRPTVRAFNAGYYWSHRRRTATSVVPWEQFFYPLDRIRHWNRMYGKHGFTQYQCLLPEAAGKGAARQLFDVLTRRGGASFLCVIKDCGPQGRGMLSFPAKGISVALDIAVRHDTQALVDALNEQVLALGGRIYLAKDSFTRPEHFRAMEPRLPAFLEVRRRWDPGLKLRSAQSVRLLGDRP
jgi:decaprenylphospho-beta-D-ribofuranose 2-oxidase